MQRQLDRLLDEAEAAASARRWDEVAEKARAVLGIDPANEDAAGFQQMAAAARHGAANGPSAASNPSLSGASGPLLPASFQIGQTTFVDFGNARQSPYVRAVAF